MKMDERQSPLESTRTHNQVEEPTKGDALNSPILEFFFTRQVLGILLCFLLFMGGIMGYFSMVKESDPDIKIARAMITTSWGGTDAETIENRVTE